MVAQCAYLLINKTGNNKQPGDEMSYEEFVTAYSRTIQNLMKYSSAQAGAMHYATEAADLADNYPEFMDRYDNEN